MENMDGARDIAAVSIPLLGGIAAASVAAAPHWSGAASAALSALLLILVSLSGSRDGALVAGLFFCLGVWCWSNGALLGSASGAREPGFLESLASEALDSFSRTIGRAGFRGQTEALVRALLIGDRSAMDRDTVKAFRDSGASHILALSGLHLGVIYLLLTKALSVLGHSPAATLLRGVVTIGACGFFTFMTGAAASTTRAFLFILINETAKARSSCKHSPLSTFCLALMIQLVLDPGVTTSAGFQLSYLAMLGIMTIYPRLEAFYPATGSRGRDRWDVMHKIWSSAALTLSCQLTTAPVAWYHFHTFPRHFLLTNLMALPLTETVITSAVTTLVLTALGIACSLMVRLTDFLAGCLEFCLRTISTM